MRYDNSVDDCLTDIYELWADLFESVYNVDTYDSDTEYESDPSDGCGFGSIRLRKSDVEAAMSGLEHKGPGNDGVPASFVKLYADNSELRDVILILGNFNLLKIKWKYGLVLL
jgi:hypothetical protein